MLRLFQYIRPYYRRLVYASGSSIANKVLDLMPPVLVGWVIDTVSGRPPAWIADVVAWIAQRATGAAGSIDPWYIAAFLATLGLLIFAFESLFQWMYQHAFQNLAQDVQHGLRMDAYNHIQAREMSFFENHRTGETMAMLGDDVNQLERFLNTGFNNLLQLLVLFAFCGVVLFSAHPGLAAVGLAPIPLIVWGSFIYRRWMESRYADVRSRVGDLSSRLENNLAGIQVIKSFTAEDFESERVSRVSRAYSDANRNAIRLSALYVPVIRMVIAIGYAGVLLVGSYMVLTGEGPNALSVGELVLFSVLIQRVLWPMTRLGTTFDEYERARASARRVFGLLDAPVVIQDPPNPVEVGRARGDVEFRDARFAYRADIPVLRGLDVRVAAGETLGIAGTTGAGKSTLVKLLLRLYDVTGGSVLIDGIDVRDMSLRGLRSNVALVSQDVYLFHGTVAENIAYGVRDEAVGLERIREAARLAELDEFVMSLPEGYATQVGEKGIKLSGGQKQRLSLARAILKDAPILVLDEATSSVDTETERAIQRNLLRLTSGRTALIIAHRLSTIRHAHRIVVLREGRVVEEGDHDTLVARGGAYADLWSVQSGSLSGV